MELNRFSTEPIFKPEEGHPWEKAAVFNAAGIYHDGLFHMVYRATNMGPHERFGRYTNALGYAASEDLIHWQRLPKPILKNDIPQESRGPEDPRIVAIDSLFYMTYCGFGGRFPDDYRICMAISG